MKTRSKVLLTLVCAVLLVTASVLGTMAYLTSTDEVVNTFTVGKVAIKLDEAKTNADGSLVYKPDGTLASRVKANSYKLLPGRTYNKDPMVTVLAGSESSYIKMKVVITNADKMKAVDWDLFTAANGYDANNWTKKSDSTVENVRTCEFWYKEKVNTTSTDVQLDALFDQITVPGTVNNAQLDALNGMTITVTAHAIQADGFANAEAAWAEYK